MFARIWHQLASLSIVRRSRANLSVFVIARPISLFNWRDTRDSILAAPLTPLKRKFALDMKSFCVKVLPDQTADKGTLLVPVRLAILLEPLKLFRLNQNSNLLSLFFHANLLRMIPNGAAVINTMPHLCVIVRRTIFTQCSSASVQENLPAQAKGGPGGVLGSGQAFQRCKQPFVLPWRARDGNHDDWAWSIIASPFPWPSSINLAHDLLSPMDRVCYGADRCRDSRPSVVLSKLSRSKDAGCYQQNAFAPFIHVQECITFALYSPMRSAMFWVGGDETRREGFSTASHCSSEC